MRMLRTLLKGLAWLIGSLTALVLVTYAVVLVANRHDRPPSQAALQLAAAYRNLPVVADADNAFVYATGFYVSPKEDPQVAGVRRITWMREVVKQPIQSLAMPSGRNYDLKSARSAAVESLSESCRDVGTECLANLNLDGAVAEWLTSERWLLDRYQQLIARPGWREDVPLDARLPIAPFASILEGQKLLLAQAWTYAEAKNATGVRELLSKDVRFWRHTLEASDFLITKMIAVAALKRNFKFGDLVLRRLPPELEAQGRPPEWSAQITRSERSMSRVWLGEWMSANRAIEVGKSQAMWAESADQGFLMRVLQRAVDPLLQPQDLSNTWAERFTRASAEVDVSYDRYRAALASSNAALASTNGGRFPPIRLYNPLGNFLLWIGGSWPYDSYGPRVVDLEGLRQVTLLASELRARGVKAGEIPAALATSERCDPYSGQPFGWDPKSASLIFTGIEPPPRGVHAVIY